MTESNEEQTIGEFDYHKALLFHINRISKLITSYPVVSGNYEVQPVMSEETRQFIIRSFYDSVELFESMLSPYLDDQYRKEVEERRKIWIERKFDLRDAGLEKYGFLLKLMDRLNLLLEKTTSGEIK